MGLKTTALIIAGSAFVGGIYGNERDLPSKEVYAARIEACASQLGEVSVLAAQPPEECDRYNFEYASEMSDEYFVPSQDLFRQNYSDYDRSNYKLGNILMGGLVGAVGGSVVGGTALMVTEFAKPKADEISDPVATQHQIQ